MAGRSLTAERGSGALLVVSLAFLLGGVAGCLAVGAIPEEVMTGITDNIRQFLVAVRAETLQGPGLLATVWNVIRWPLLVVILSFFALGTIGIPVLFFVRGVLLSFCISALLAALGSGGMLLAVMLLGMGSLLTIPVLFVLGTQGFSASLAVRNERAGRMHHPSMPSRLCLAVCIVFLLGGVLWEGALPTLLTVAANLFPA